MIELYKLFLNKEKALYATINRMKKEDKLYLGCCWIPRTDKIKLDTKLDEIKDSNRNVEVPTFTLVADHGAKPPSMFRINEFTWAF